MASASLISSPEPPEILPGSLPKEIEDPEVDDGNFASELREPSALQEKTEESALQSLSVPDSHEVTANPKSDRSFQQSSSSNSSVTTEADDIGVTLQAVSKWHEDRVEQSDNSSICSNIIEEEDEISNDNMAEDPNAFTKQSDVGHIVDDRPPDHLEEEVQPCGVAAEIPDTPDDSSCQKSVSESIITYQKIDMSSNSEGSLLKDSGNDVSEIGGSEGIRSRRGVSRMGSATVLHDDGSQHHDGIRNTLRAESESLLFSPTEVIFKIIELEIRIATVIFMTALLAIKFMFKGIFHPIQTVREANDKIAEALRFVFEKIAWVWPLFKKLASNFSSSLLGGTYITIVLGFLLLPALVLAFLFSRTLVEEPIQVKEVLLFNYSLPHPSASVSIFSSHQMFKKGHFAEGDSSEFLSRQVIAAALHKFNVIVTLTMPESEYNIQLGSFQVSAELLSPTGRSLAKFYQPCMMRFYSTPVRYLRSMVTMIPTFFGLYAETQRHVLRLVHSYLDPKDPVGSVKISLEPRASFTVGAGLPDIYSAEVLVQSELPLSKSLIYKFRLLIFLWIASALFGMEVAIMLCYCRQILFPKILFG